MRCNAALFSYRIIAVDPVEAPKARPAILMGALTDAGGRLFGCDIDTETIQARQHRRCRGDGKGGSWIHRRHRITGATSCILEPGRGIASDVQVGSGPSQRPAWIH